MSDDENQYSQLRSRIKSYNVETSALNRKLQSKVQALQIMRKECERFRTERDQFKLMAETLQLRYSSIKRTTTTTDTSDKSKVASILHETREQNMKLTTEVEALKQKLHEMQGDIEILREARTPSKKHGKTAKQPTTTRANRAHTAENEDYFQWQEERANFICHLEHLKKKNAQLAFDAKALIDEKEELTKERDAYKCKAHRLNHELCASLKANQAHPKFIDIDSLILENKFLHEMLKSCELEVELAKQTSSKYKTMLESKRKKGIIKLGSKSNEDNILSHKQVKNLLESGVELPSKTETIEDLKSLCLTLLDSLNDKNLALNHQRKTNKILGTKITELESRIQSLVNIQPTSTSFSPSQFLLDDYSPSTVDSSTETSTTIKSETNENKISNDSEETSAKGAEYKRGATRMPCSQSDDCTSSMSTESGKSILSSEYGGGDIPGANNNESFGFSEFTNNVDVPYHHHHHRTPTTSTSTPNDSDRLNAENINGALVPKKIQEQRISDLKDLPPELAEMVLQQLHELDLRYYEENYVIEPEKSERREDENESAQNEERASDAESATEQESEATLH